MPKQKLNALTGLRFFAAMAIVIHHLHGYGLPADILPSPMLDNGVSLFFVLSGFILTYGYPGFASSAEIRRFWVARFARIWPAHIAALVLCYALLNGDPSRLGTGVDTWPLWLANVTLIHAWIPYAESFFGYNNVSWSISTEAFFYLAFPFLIAGLARTWWWKLSGTLLIALALVAISQAAGWKVFTQVGDGLTLTGVVYINPLARLFEFTLGMCTAVAWQALRPRLQLGPAAGTVAEVAALALVWVSSIGVTLLGAWINGVYGFAGAQWLGQGGGMALSFAALIFIMACQAGAFGRLLGTRLFVVLGEISYMIYLIHFVILRAYQMRIDWFAAWSGEALFAAYMAIVLGLSWLLWRTVEAPMRRWIVDKYDLYLADGRRQLA